MAIYSKAWYHTQYDTGEKLHVSIITASTLNLRSDIGYHVCWELLYWKILLYVVRSDIGYHVCWELLYWKILLYVVMHWHFDKNLRSVYKKGTQHRVNLFY